MRSSAGPKLQRRLCQPNRALVRPSQAGFAAVDGDLPADADRFAAEEQQALLAALGLAQVLLRERVAVLGDGGDDGVQVLLLPGPHAEHLVVAGMGQRLEHRGPTHRAHEGLDLLRRSGNQRARMHIGRQIREVEAPPGAEHALGIVDHEGSAQAQPPTEIEDGGGRRGLRLAQRVVANEDDVETRQGVLLADRVAGEERPVEVGGLGVVAGPHPQGAGEDAAVVEKGQVVGCDEADLVPPAVRRPREVHAPEGRLQRRKAADEKPDAHAGTLTAVGPRGGG